MITSCRHFINNTADNTDTESTDDELRIGGLGKYSHGDLHLTHQHWVMQLEVAGGFNVNNTEAAEANHRPCMVLPAKRVRHSATNRTYNAMQSYLRNDFLFTTLHEQHIINQHHAQRESAV